MLKNSCSSCTLVKPNLASRAALAFMVVTITVNEQIHKRITRKIRSMMPALVREMYFSFSRPQIIRDAIFPDFSRIPDFLKSKLSMKNL